MTRDKMGRKPTGRARRWSLARPLTLAAALLAAVFATVLVALGGGPSGAFAASLPAAEGQRGMAVSEHRLASEAGARILAAGGNAIDAAVAMGYVLAVVNPCCGNIGGGGFMTLRLADGRALFLNFRETAPAAARADMFAGPNDVSRPAPAPSSRRGWLAVATPGSVMGLDQALSRHGRLKREAVMAPAIALAREGFALTRADTDILDSAAAAFAHDPAARSIFLRPDGSALRPGDRLVQSDLANVLQQISEGGPDAFYRGPVARAVAAASRAQGGILTEQDFANYTVTEQPPLACSYRGSEILSAPPPSSGGVTLCEILNILEGYDMKALGFHSARAVHLMVEAMRHAYRDRNSLLGDPAFVAIPLDRLLSKDYAASIRARIDPARATPADSRESAAAPGRERPQTTHFAVVDAEGNAVSTTVTINGFFGAGVIAPGTGFFLNNEMDDFTARPGVPNMFGLIQGEANAIAPGKRPLSSMAPTLVMKNGQLALATGSPGGPRIITTVLQVLMNVIDYGMEPQEAADAPRLHHQGWPDQIDYEPYALSPDTMAILAGMGHRLVQKPKWGAAGVIEVGAAGAGRRPSRAVGNDEAMSGAVLPGYFYGANDSRRPAGAAVGY